MQKLNKLILILLLAVLFESCGEYNKVLNKGPNTDRYKIAVALYESGDYKKAIPLFEKLMGPYANKPQMERIQFMVAKSAYETHDFTLSAYYFTKFITNYPESSKVEEATFLGAKSYYLATPKYSRDQQDTNKALRAFQDFIDAYPNSDLIGEANKLYKDLNSKLEKKQFEVAKQYYHTEHYTAAITAFDIFNEEHLGSKYKEDALYYRFKAAYDLGMKSVLTKKEERLLEAKQAYYKFHKSFPNSKRKDEVNHMLEQIDKAILEVKKEFEIITQ